MKRCFSISLALIMSLTFSVSATIINVPVDQPTIQAGIDVSSDGDTVLVQPGTYVENILIDDKNIILGSLFLTSNDTSYISQTIIDGDSTGSVVRFSNCPETTMRITGFTIRNGYSTMAGGGVNISTSSPLINHNLIMENVAQYFGGGINIHGYTNPTIINNQIVGNVLIATTGGFEGGGISCYSDNAIISFNTMYENYGEEGGAIFFQGTSSSNTVISNNNIYENSANKGGGIFITGDCYAEITDNIISDNDAEYSGGALHIEGGSYPNISGNTINGNSAYFAGSGIYCTAASPTISNNAISNNQSNLGYGGGLAFYDSSNAIVHQNQINGNDAGLGGGIFGDFSDLVISNNTIFGNTGLDGTALCLRNSNPIIINSIIWPDTANISQDLIETSYTSYPVITYCDIYDTLWTGDGNISEDPMFVNPDIDDFHLQEGSPCIDAGDPGSPYDPDSTICDIGAFYYDQDVAIDELDDILPSDFLLSQNYPNPFNASTLIRYELPKQSNVKIEIFDILGRKITTLQDRLKLAGKHQIIWHADDLPSGIYFYKLQADDYSEVRKMTLVK